MLQWDTGLLMRKINTEFGGSQTSYGECASAGGGGELRTIASILVTHGGGGLDPDFV